MDKEDNLLTIQYCIGWRQGVHRSRVCPLRLIKQMCVRVVVFMDHVVTRKMTNAPSVAEDASLVVMETIPVGYKMYLVF